MAHALSLLKGNAGPGRNHLDAKARNGIIVVQRANRLAARRACSEPLRHTPNNSDENGKTGATAGSRSTGRPARSDAAENSIRQTREELAQPLDHFGARLHAVGRTYKHINRAELMLLQPERLAYAAFDPVAYRRSRRMLARHEHSKSRLATLTRRQEEHEPIAAPTLASVQQELKVRLAAQSLLPRQPESRILPGPGSATHVAAKRPLDGKTPTTRGAATANDAAATLGPHAHEKAVSTGTTRLRRLVSPFHDIRS